MREALSAVLRALDADVTRHSVPVATRDVDASGEIRDPFLRDALGAVVVELAHRAGQARAPSATVV